MRIRNGIRSLSEAIILQSIEDLWDSRHRDECARFFGGEGFEICAGLAGIGMKERMKLFSLLGRSTAMVHPPGVMDIHENTVG